jgi:hypothetical protein
VHWKLGGGQTQHVSKRRGELGAKGLEIYDVCEDGDVEVPVGEDALLHTLADLLALHVAIGPYTRLCELLPRLPS